MMSPRKKSQAVGWQRLMVAVLTIVSSLAAGCGGGGGGDGGGPGSAPLVSLKTTVQRTLTNAPVVTVTLQRQNGQSIANATVAFEQDVTMAGITVPVALVATSSADGVASRALKAGDYRMSLQGDANLPTNVGTFLETLSVTGDRTVIRRTSEQQWNINAPPGVTLEEVIIEAFLCDANGVLLKDRDGNHLDPVLTHAAPATGPTITVTTELFQGTYRVSITGVPVDPAAQLARFLSGKITAQGGGQNDPVEPVNLSNAGNSLTLDLRDPNNVGLEGFEIMVIDRSTLLPLGSATTVQGVATVLTGSFSDVVALVSDTDGALRGVLPIQALAPPGAQKTMQLRNVQGRVVPAGGATLSPTEPANIVATAKNGLGLLDSELDKPAPMDPPGIGTFSMQLFGTSPEGLPHQLEAVGVQGFPTVTPLPLTVVAGTDLADQVITVSPGGVFTGRLQDEAGTNLQGVDVIVVGDVDRDGVKSIVSQTKSAADGTYTIEVPFGPYDLWVGGAVAENLAVSAAAPTSSRNFRQFQVTGRLTDSTGAGVAATVVHGQNPDGDLAPLIATANALGVFTVKLFEGRNFVCYDPPANRPTLGSECITNVVVDQPSVQELSRALSTASSF